jgi:hypothetical protein
MPPFTWPLSQGFDPSGPKKLNEVVFDWKERVSCESTFIAFRLLLPLRLFRSMFAKAFRFVVPRRRRINGKRPAACAPEFRVEVLALSSCSLQVESNARRKRCRCSFEIRGFRRPGNEFRMPCEGPGFRLIQRPIWSGKFARVAGGVFPRSVGRPSLVRHTVAWRTSAPFTQRNRSDHLGDNDYLYQRIDVRRTGRKPVLEAGCQTIRECGVRPGLSGANGVQV